MVWMDLADGIWDELPVRIYQQMGWVYAFLSLVGIGQKD